MAEPDPCALLILAAGGSKRMGRPKQLLSVGGEPLVRKVTLAALGSNLRPAIVVLGAQAHGIRPHLEDLAVSIVENPRWQDGVASSLRTGVGAVMRVAPHARGLIVILADQPRLTAAHLTSIESAQRASGRTIVASDYGDHLGPPAYFGCRHFAALQALQGDVGARELLRAFAAETIAAPAGSGDDLDSPGDFGAFGAETGSA
jgi:molybdenum cofactor cytidylyltransferase